MVYSTSNPSAIFPTTRKPKLNNFYTGFTMSDSIINLKIVKTVWQRKSFKKTSFTIGININPFEGLFVTYTIYTLYIYTYVRTGAKAMLLNFELSSKGH